MSFGVFEASVASEQEQQYQQREATDKLNAAIYDVKDKFGQFLFGARDLEEYHDRLALCRNDVIRAVEPHLFPRTGVMRRVLKPIEREFKATLQRQADDWGVPTTDTGKKPKDPSSPGESVFGPGFNTTDKIVGPAIDSSATGGGGQPYSVRPGDTLSDIAAQHGVSLEDLKGANPQFSSNWDLIHPTESVNIPGGAPSGATRSAPPSSSTNTPAPSGGLVGPSVGGGPAPAPTVIGPSGLNPTPPPASTSFFGPGGLTNRNATLRTAVDDNDPAVGASTAPTPNLGIDQMGASGAAASAQPPAATGAFGAPVAPLTSVPVGGRRARRRADKTGPAMDLDVTYSPSDDELVPEGDFKGYLDDVSQGAEEKADRNFGGTWPGGQEHDEVAHFAAWCRQANIRPSLAALDRYGPTDRAYFTIAAALQRHSADVGDPNAIIPNTPIQQGLAGEGAQVPQPNSVAVPAAAGVAQGTPGIIRQQRRHTAEEYQGEGDVQDESGPFAGPHGSFPVGTQKDLNDAKSVCNMPSVKSKHPSICESVEKRQTPKQGTRYQACYPGCDKNEEHVRKYHNKDKEARRRIAVDENDFYDWAYRQGIQDISNPAIDVGNLIDQFAKVKKISPEDNKYLRGWFWADSPTRNTGLRYRSDRRRTAAPNYLQKADEALTNLLNQKAEEFQTSVAPLQQALQTVQQAEAMDQAANPLNVQPPAGTVNVLPGQDQQSQMDPNAVAALVNGGGGDPSGGAPPGGDQGIPPAAGDQGALPPELAQQLQAARIGPRMLTAAMSQRRYSQIADIVATLPREHKSRVAPMLADMFKANNPRFSRDKFFAAVGYRKRGDRPKGPAANRRQATGTHPSISAKDSCQTCWNNSAERGGSDVSYLDLIKANHHQELLDHFRHDQYLDQQRHPQREHKRGPGRHTDRAAAILDEWNQWLAQPGSRGDESDVEQFATQKGYGPRALKKLRTQLWGPQHAMTTAAAAGPEEDLWWAERGDPHPEHDRARWRREVNPYAENPEALHPSFRHLHGWADLGAPTQKATNSLRYPPYDPHATARWWERRYLNDPQQFVSALHNPDHAENFFPFLRHNQQGQITYDPNWPSVRVYDENTARWAKRGQRKQAWTGWSPTGQSSRQHKVAGWNWDHHLNGYITTAADKFACDCGEEHDTPSYHQCKCGKVWNSYVVGSGSGREAALEKVICREVPHRRDMIVAKKKYRADLAHDLDKSIHDEQTAQDEYTDYAQDAERSGRPEAADRYREVRKDEVQHEKEFRDLRQASDIGTFGHLREGDEITQHSSGRGGLTVPGTHVRRVHKIEDKGRSRYITYETVSSPGGNYSDPGDKYTSRHLSTTKLPGHWKVRRKEGMRRGAPFADYSDWDDCVNKNRNKVDNVDAYCGEIKHRTEDKKAAWDRDTGWANRGVDDDQLGNAAFSYSDELKPVKPKSPPKMNKPPADWHKRTPNGRWTGYSKRYDITKPGGTPDEEGEDNGEAKPKSMPKDWHHRDQNQRWTK